MCDPAADAGSSGSLKRQAAAWRAATRLKAGAGAGLRTKTVCVTVNGVQLVVLLLGFVALQGRSPLSFFVVFSVNLVVVVF